MERELAVQKDCASDVMDAESKKNYALDRAVQGPWKEMTFEL